MQLSSALLSSQQPVISPYLGLDESSPHPPYFFKVNFNIILSSTPRSYKWFFRSGFSSPPLHTCHMLLSSHAPSYGHPNNVWWWLQIMKHLQSPVTSSLVAPDIFLSTLLSKSFSLCSSRSVRHQVHTRTNNMQLYRLVCYDLQVFI
jgi:hypothetical protein